MDRYIVYEVGNDHDTRYGVWDRQTGTYAIDHGYLLILAYKVDADMWASRLNAQLVAA